MDAAEFQQKKRALLADRAAGRIGELAFRRALDELQQSSGAVSASRTGSSADASTLWSPDTTPQRNASGLHVGDEFDEYRLAEYVGGGAFGHVWKAYSEPEDRYVALKILPPELSCNPREIERVMQCFQKIHRLHHQHICPVYRLGQHAQHGYFLVMQFVAGMPLYRWREVLGATEVSLGQVVKLLSMAAGALDYAHAQKVVHRDVKPGNMMCTPDASDLQVVDFGLAEQIHSSMSRVSGKVHETVGSPAFMSPEACSGQRQDGRSDQYSLACVAYYLIAGRMVFDGVPWIVLNCHRQQPPQPIESAGDAVNAALMRALEKEPERRFESCTAFVDALRAARAKPSAVSKPKVSEPRRAAPESADWGAWQVCDHPLPESRVRALIFARNSQRLVAAYADGTVITRTIDDARWTRWSHDLTPNLRAATFTPAGGFLVLANRNRVNVIDSSKERVVARMEIPRTEINDMGAASTGRQVCCAATTGRDTHRFVFVDLVAGKARRTLRARSVGLTAFGVSHDGRWLAECGSDGIFLHSLRRMRLAPVPKLRTGPDCIGVQVQFSPDDRLLAVRMNNGRMQVFDLATCESILAELPDQAFRWFTFSISGRQIVTVGGDCSVRCLDPFSGSEDARHELPGPSSRIAVSDSGYVAAALDDGGLIVSADPLLG